MATVEPLLTAEEYYRLPDDGQPSELIRGRVVPLNFPQPRHGYYCANTVRILGNYVSDHRLGRVMCNDSGIVTERGPDTVRGADVAFYSYDRLPHGPIPAGHIEVVPELIFEVRSPGDRWPQIHGKVAEYLNASVTVVCVLDEQTERLIVYTTDNLPRVLTAEQEFALPELLGDFRVLVRSFFE